ncbi:hypothetical protein LSUB1_G007488 [Lachnellula subtilissima]|uniref:Uncharacterized protein n=1 Tax=Lachnellula subtilissima TaxID=602034 RepID=A0A8H8U621_9HELO|nr:hypothetical protein LSUB1_G007488 [Lachnellula subtilissima]
MHPKTRSGTKRKAPLVAVDFNAPPAKKVAESRKRDSAAASTSASTGQKTYKYSDASSIYTVAWAEDNEDEDEDEDENGDEDTEKDKNNGNDGEEMSSREVTDKGFPITQAGFDMFKHIVIEQEKRDPDCHDMYIFNDYAGYGMTEVLENLLMDFNKILFKKDVSPLKKWSYIEGLVVWLYYGDLMSLMMNDDSDSVKDIFNFFITLMVTSLEMLNEHSLINPTSAVPSVNICTLIMIKFFQKDTVDFAIKNVEKIVQAADEAGVVWDFRKELGVSEEDIKALRVKCKQGAKKVDWKKEASWNFKRNHAGGRNYDITKMSKAEKKNHALDGGGSGDW